jgi:hypothetical protein
MSGNSELVASLDLSDLLSRLNLSAKVPVQLPEDEGKDRYTDRSDGQGKDRYTDRLDGQGKDRYTDRLDGEGQDQDRYSQALHKMVNWPRDEENKVRTQVFVIIHLVRHLSLITAWWSSWL